jgi:hypothetical protein
VPVFILHSFKVPTAKKIENHWPRGTKEKDRSGRDVCVYQSKHFRYTPWRRLGGEDV